MNDDCFWNKEEFLIEEGILGEEHDYDKELLREITSFKKRESDLGELLNKKELTPLELAILILFEDE